MIAHSLQSACTNTSHCSFRRHLTLPCFPTAITLGKLKINLFGALFGIWEVFWGIVFWYPALTLYRLLRWVSRSLPGDVMQKIDPFRRIPICAGYMWGLLSMTVFGMWPAVEGRENLEVLREVDENGKKG